MLVSIEVLDNGLKSAKRITTREKAPAREGMDPTLIKMYCLWEGDVRLKLNELNFKAEQHPDPEIGQYLVGEDRGVKVHLHGGLEALLPSLSYHVRVMMRTWEPVGAAERNGGARAFRNYDLYLDVVGIAPDPAGLKLSILNGHQRHELGIPSNVINPDEMTFSHISMDLKRAQTIVVEPCAPPRPEW